MPKKKRPTILDNPTPRQDAARLALLAAGCLGAWSLTLDAAAADYQLQPIATRSAQTLSEITLNGTYTHFKDVTLQEADDFDGWSVDVDLTIPFKDRFQLWLFLPLRTEGDARLTDPGSVDRGERIDIEGNGGVYGFPSVVFEHQLRFEDSSDYNLAYYLGYGQVLDPLDTTAVSGDKYNHRGKMLSAGVKLGGHRWNDSIRLIGNFGLRYYFDTDDLSPAGDVFTYADFKGAAIFKPWGQRLFPVLELTYLGNFGDYNAPTLMPELIYAFNSNWEAKAGVPIGLGGDGNQFGASAQLTYRF